MRQAKAEEREQLEGQLAQQKEEARRVQDKLQEEKNVRRKNDGCISECCVLQVLQGKLDELEEFRLNKERLEKEGREMAAEIERLKQEKEEVVYGLEKKAVLNCDR